MILNDLGEYLEDNGLGVVGEDIFIGELPLETNNCLGLTFAVSPAPNKSIPYYNQQVDIWARYSVYDQGLEKLQHIFDFFHKKENYQMGSFHVYLSYAAGMIDDLDRDAERRHLFKLSLVFVYRGEDEFIYPLS